MHANVLEPVLDSANQVWNELVDRAVSTRISSLECDADISSLSSSDSIFPQNNSPREASKGAPSISHRRGDSLRYLHVLVRPAKKPYWVLPCHEKSSFTPRTLFLFLLPIEISQMLDEVIPGGKALRD